MAMILLMVITLASFLSIEARLAAANQLRTQARMQALVSLRLALAHLQQEAGPDRRATFRADITRYATATDASKVPTWSNVLNPMWTGVQRTDRPFQPPAWIISGRGDKPAGTQMVSLAQPSATDSDGKSTIPFFAKIDYSTDYWVPWDKNDKTSGNYDGGPAAYKIILVGDATATAAENESGTDPLSGRPDGRVSLPPVTLPDTNVAGRYCYWVGDEGVKANIAVNDPRLQNSSTLASARRGVARTGVELFSGFSNYQPGDIDNRVISTDQLKLLSSTVFSDSTGTNAKALWPDVTLVSRGLFTDNRWGGLQIDLSTAFENPDFINSEFADGDGTTEAKTADIALPALGNVTFGFDVNGDISYASPLSASNSWRVPFIFSKKQIYDQNSNTPTKHACVWAITTTILKTSPTKVIRGPTWASLRDYHLLYKYLSYDNNYSGTPYQDTPILSARPHFPNTVALRAANNFYYNTLGIGYFHYSQMYNRSISPLVYYNGTSWVRDATTANTDLYGQDTIYTRPTRGNSYSTTINNSNISSKTYPLPIPTKVSVAPYISRQLIVIGAIQTGGTPSTVGIVLSPITVFHNPYNVILRVGKQRISLRDLDTWSLQFRRYYDTSKPPQDSWMNYNTWDITNLGQPWDKWAPDNNLNYLGLIQQKNSSASSAQSLYFDFDGFDIMPGEFKVFSAENISQTFPIKMKPGFLQTNGLYAIIKANYKTGFNPGNPADLTVTRDDTRKLQIELIPCWKSQGFKIVHQIECALYGDSLSGSTSSSLDSAYNTSSVVSELNSAPFFVVQNPPPTIQNNGASINGFFHDRYDFKNEKSGGPDNRDPAPYVIRSSMPIVGDKPDIIGVYDYSIRWPSESGAFPIFARSNPMAASTRVDANDMTWDSSSSTSAPGPVVIGNEYYSSTSPSYKLLLYPQSGNASPLTWSNLVQTSLNNNAYGGMSSDPSTGGVTNAVYTEVPLGPPLSLAQYAHANFGLRDQDPLLAIGNSLGPTFSVHGITYKINGTSTTSSEFDQSSIINKALFDRYFLSGAAPDLLNNRDLAKVLDDFANGTGTLANPSTVLMSSFDAATTRGKLNNHRLVATVTARQGAFNVHSMSKRAWAAVLAGAKAKALSNESGDASLNARFPRAVRKDRVNASGVNKAPYNTTAAWTGLTNLDDGQIRSLAKAIVDETTIRLSYYHREAGYCVLGGILSGVQAGDFHLLMNGGAGNGKIRGLASGTAPYGTLPMPFQGLAQFVNRSNCPIDSGGKRYRAGVIQTAITIADANGANLANRSNTPDVTMPLNGASYTPLDTNLTPPFIYTPPPSYISKVSTLSNNSTDYREQTKLSFNTAPNSSIDYGDVKIAAPTALLQSDILAAIGDSLTTRSDTFTIRAYGDVSDKPGGPAAGTCWIEAVVQRTPDFIDSKDPAERMVYNLYNGYGHNDQKSNPDKGLQPANINLGRRFVIVSMRILKPNEL